MTAVAGVTLAALTGCSSDKPADEKSAPSTPAASKPAPAPSTTEAVSEEEATQAKAISVYETFWAEMERLYADKGTKTDSLKKYAAAEALVNGENGIKTMHAGGKVVTGKVVLGDTTVTKSDLDRKVPNVFLSVCLDVSKWNVLHADSGKPVALPSTRLTKYVVEATVEEWPQGWRVVRNRPQEKPC